MSSLFWVMSWHVVNKTELTLLYVHISHIYLYLKYIYIVIHRQTCPVLSELFSVARQARFSKLGSKLGWLKRQSKNSTTQPRGNQRKQRKLKRLYITIVIIYIYPLNGYREHDSYEEPCITLVANHLLHSLESSTLLGLQSNGNEFDYIEKNWKTRWSKIRI